MINYKVVHFTVEFAPESKNPNLLWLKFLRFIFNHHFYRISEPIPKVFKMFVFLMTRC